jgi:membrane-bound lytic murein transglycosylase B
MKWNRSEYYAISVGRLADQIAGGGKLVRPIPDVPTRLPLDTIRTLQENLAIQGFNVGTIDGLIGPATRRAIAAWQHARGFIPDGFTHQETLSALSGETVPATATP